MSDDRAGKMKAGETMDREKLPDYIAAVDRLLDAPADRAEQAEASRWFQLGAPVAHAAVSIKATRLIARPAGGDA